MPEKSARFSSVCPAGGARGENTVCEKQFFEFWWARGARVVRRIFLSGGARGDAGCEKQFF